VLNALACLRGFILSRKGGAGFTPRPSNNDPVLIQSLLEKAREKQTRTGIEREVVTSSHQDEFERNDYLKRLCEADAI
jgi:hypothetical protein